jgi:glycosyltransferase involved in cell wall biosynthesis
LAPLAGIANVQLRPPMPRPALCALIRSADAGLIPHHVTALTTAMSPLKLMEYLGAGLPVVATDTEPIRALHHPRVQLVPDGGDFTDGARRALAMGRSAEAPRLQFLSAQSWRARHDELLDFVLGAATGPIHEQSR